MTLNWLRENHQGQLWGQSVLVWHQSQSTDPNTTVSNPFRTPSRAGFSLIRFDAKHFLVVTRMFMGARLSHPSLKPWQHELEVKWCPVWALIKWYQLVFCARAGGSKCRTCYVKPTKRGRISMYTDESGHFTILHNSPDYISHSPGVWHGDNMSCCDHMNNSPDITPLGGNHNSGNND